MSIRRLGPVLVGLSLFLALGERAAAQPRRLPSPIPRSPIVVRPAPKPPKPKIPKLPRAVGAVSRKFEVAVITKKSQTRLAVTLTASTVVDERVLAYLEKTLHVVPIDPAAAKEQAAWLQHAGPDRPGHDVAVALATLDGKAVTDHVAMPPDGVELVRPGILRVREELVAGLAAKRNFRFTDVVIPIERPRPEPPRPPPPRPEPPPAVEGLHGTLKCRANETDTTTMDRLLPFVKIKVGAAETTARADGTFTVPGSFASGAFSLELTYDAPVVTGTLSTPLRVMAEFHDARGQTLRRTASLAGDRISVGEVIVTGPDCEIWRLGAAAVDDYHQSVGRQPPDRELRLKRWSAVWGGTPYAYYDYIVLATNFPTDGNYRFQGTRRGTIFHEFGHTVRHVADGDELHWGWDNFRWAYARFHGGCETFNVQYAFNEGWAGFWAAERGARGIDGCSKGPLFVDWTENMIASRLLELSNALSTDPKVRASKMVQVLEGNPGAIHSLRDFEMAYCRLHAAGNAQCASASAPRRPAPASCPPEFIDDGATCRLDNIRAKPSYGRGVGTVPTSCGSGRELDAGLCYPTCQAGYNGVGPVCWKSCPSGFRDDGAFCAKPDAYGRGLGYPWQWGDRAFDLDQARDRCRAANPQGCEQDGLIWYPRCRSGFHSFGCCVCTPNCPAGMPDIGVSCAKPSYGRGVGTVPTACSGGNQYDTGLCYVPCRAGWSGVGPVCWGQCPAGFDDHGATCYREPAIIVKF